MDVYHEIATLSSLHEALNNELMADSGRMSPGQVSRQKNYRDIVSQLQAINMEEVVVRLVADGVNPDVLARVEAQISRTLQILEERKQMYDSVEFGSLLDLYEKYCYDRQYSRIKEDVKFISSYPYQTEQERIKLLNECTCELNRLDNERAEFRRNNADWIGANFYSKIERLCLSNKRIISSYYNNKVFPIQGEFHIDFAKYLTRFLSEYLPHQRNVSKNTIASYRDSFVQFINYMKDINGIPVERLLLKHLTRDNVINYLQWLHNTKKNTSATCNYRLAAIRSFCSYLQYIVIDNMVEWQSILSIKAKKTEISPPNYLSMEGIKLLLAQPDTTSWKGRRHLALLSLMYDTGARVQEIADLTVDCVRIDTTPYTIRLTGKGRKTRIVPLAEAQVDILRSYMEENNLNDPNMMKKPLFFNGRHEKLTREGITYILKIYADMANKQQPEIIPKKISCHSIRHSKAMHLLQAGVNLVYIRDILGHVSIQTTDIYARADSKAKREALENAYTRLTPNTITEKEWERNKNLLEWLKGLGH